MAQEFDRPAGHLDLVMPPPVDFPETGLPEEQVLEEIRQRIADDPSIVAKNFGISYVGPPHPITARVTELVAGTVFVEWTRGIFPSAYGLEKEAVRMMGSLLGAPNAVGFITSGGTESNVSALRLARNLGRKSRPEVILPESAHYSFRLGAELLGLDIRWVPIGSDQRPDMGKVRSLVNRNTIALVCSAPEGHFGVLDPVEEFADLAQRTGLYLHVDAAFGGFILPFMQELGYQIPKFDFSLPGVTSIMTDGHKLGLLPVATGFFLVRDQTLLNAIPTETTMIHTLTATKPGSHAATAWAVMKHLGRSGYRDYVRHVLEVVDVVANGIESIDGLQLCVKPMITLVSFTSDTYDVAQIDNELRARGWGRTSGIYNGKPYIRLSIHPHRDVAHAKELVQTLREIVGSMARSQ